MRNKTYIAIALLFSACTFTPEPEYFKMIDDKSTAEVILDADFPDTLIVDEIKSLEYRVVFYGYYEGWMTPPTYNHVTIGGVEYDVNDRKRGPFELATRYPNITEKGYYDFTFTVVHGSFTGSLADRNGYEGGEKSESCVLYFDPNPAVEVDLELSVMPNGDIEVSWDYPHTNLNAQQLIRVVYENGTPTITYIDLDTEIESYLDTEFTADKVEYSLWVRNWHSEIAQSAFVSYEP